MVFNNMKSFKLYRRMLVYLSAYWPWIAVSVILSFLVVNFELLSLWFGGTLVQTLFDPSKMHLVKPAFSLGNINNFLKYWTAQAIQRDNPLDSLKLVCLLMAITFFLKNALIYLKSLVMTMLNLGVIKDLRNQLFNHTMRLPVSYYDRNQSGNIMSLIMNDTASINSSMTTTFDKLFIEPLRVLFFIALLFVINAKLTLVVFLIFPVLGFMIATIGKSVRRRSKRVLEFMAGLVTILHESIGGIRAVKMFNMNECESEKFEKENKKFVHHAYRAAAVGALSSPITESLGVVVVIILLWYGGRQVLGAGTFKADDFVRFLLFLFSSFTPLKALTTLSNTLQAGFAAAERVFTILDAPIEPLVSLQPENVPSFMSDITFSNVSFTYAGTEKPVLQDLTFSVKKGSIVALVGSSGAGKSTILDLLPRFYDVTAGSIAIDKKNIAAIDLVGLRHLFGIVSQETILFNDTVYNNIAYGQRSTSREAVLEAATAANALEFIEKMDHGFDTIVGERGVMLSGGQRQRLSIARALLRNPPILILDEATSALDTESERLVQSAINNLITNRTAIVVAHRLSTIRHADQILVLEAGRIVEQGTHEELLTLGKRYKYFFDIQFSAAALKSGV